MCHHATRFSARSYERAKQPPPPPPKMEKKALVKGSVRTDSYQLAILCVETAHIRGRSIIFDTAGLSVDDRPFCLQ